MLRALIVDDEELARRGLEIRLAGFDDIEIWAQARNGREALAAARDQSPDLMFLDVQMPGRSGLDVLGALDEAAAPAAVVLTTAFDQYAIRAFDANALDYLLKPIAPARLAAALAREGIAACLAALERERSSVISRRLRQVKDKLSSWRGRAGGNMPGW